MKINFHIILVACNIIAAVSLFLACLCIFVNPQSIWWISFFGLAYMHLMVANLLFVATWVLLRKWKFLMISAVALLIGCPFIGRNVQLFEKEIPDEEFEQSYKILSFNVEFFSRRNLAQPSGDVLNFIRDEDADIICLQEYVVSNADISLDENTILKKFEKTPFYHSELKDGNIGVATFSKYPIIHKEALYKDKSANICMCSDIVTGTDTVRVYNVHLKSVGFRESEKDFLNNTSEKSGLANVRTFVSIIRHLKSAYNNRAVQVEILSMHIAQSPYPVIVCGDFNDPPMSFTYRKVRGNRKDAFVEAGSGRSTTYNIGRIASLRIDYILYSDVFKAYSYQVPRVYLSDHFPVTCRIVKKN